MTDPDIPRPPPEGGLARLLRRRRRIGRNQRHYGGKTTHSWAEYSSVPLQTTGDHSSPNRWAFVFLGVAAPLLPILLLAVAIFGARDQAAFAAWEGANNIAGILALFLIPFIAFAALLLIGTRVRIWLERRMTNRPGKEPEDPAG